MIMMKLDDVTESRIAFQVFLKYTQDDYKIGIAFIYNSVYRHRSVIRHGYLMKSLHNSKIC